MKASPEREGRNPATGEKIKVAASKKPSRRNSRGDDDFGSFNSLSCGLCRQRLREEGRTAEWFIAGLTHGGGNVAVIVGRHRYLAQELNEMGFRSYFRESAADFQMLETIATLKEPEIAYEATRRRLQTEPDWVGLYIAGGGITGVMRALREDGGPVAKRLTVVAHELTNDTRAGLAEGLINIVLSHPAKLLAETLVRAMAEALNADRASSVS